MTPASNRGKTFCICRKHAWHPECPVHGRRRVLPLLPALAFLFLVVVACVTVPKSEARDEATPPGLVICRVFGPTCAKAVEVSYCESGMRPTAVSRTRDVGLFQINYAAHHKPGESFAAFKQRMIDPARNTRFAHRLSRGGRDWEAWRWSRHCWGGR